jgi:tetratricopeptide (TPR) repeat protein
VLLLGFMTVSVSARDRPDEIIRSHDIVHFKNRIGEVVVWTCNIIEENTSELTVEKLDDGGKVVGVFPIDKAKIDKILRAASAKVVYLRKAKRLPDIRDSSEERALAQLDLGLWCRTPLAELGGGLPAESKSYKHLLDAVRLKNDLVEAYPHLLDILVAKGASEKGVSLDEELEIFLHARNGGFSHLEMDLRMGEIFVELGWTERAVQRFEEILNSEEPINESVVSRARQHLAGIHLTRGEGKLAAALFEPAPGTGEVADAGANDGTFDDYYLRAKMLLISARPEDRTHVRELLEQASQLQPNFYGVHVHLAALDLLDGKPIDAEKRMKLNSSLGEGNPEYVLARGLVSLERGHFKSAKDMFDDAEAKLNGSEDAELLSRGPLIQSQIHLARGLLSEYSGRLGAAIEEYHLAWDMAPDGALLSVRSTVGILLARALRNSRDVRGARRVLDELVEGHASDPGIFSAYARVLADVALASDDVGEAARLLGYAVRYEGRDARLLAKYGTVLLHLGKLDAAFQYLTRAKEIDAGLPEVQCALGSYHYSRGDLEASGRAFRAVLELAAQEDAVGDRADELAYCREYADVALMLVDDARQLEVWEDNFDRESEEILRGWSTVDHFGIRVMIQENHVAFAGTQTNSPDGVTKLFREEQSENVERVSARFRFPSENSGRAGIRIETKSKEGAGLVVVRDFDGHIRIALRDKIGEWHDLAAEDDGDPAKGRLVYSDQVVCPNDGKFHTLMIRRAEVRQGGKGFDCLLDGVPVAYNLRIAKFTTKKSIPILVGVSGQARDVEEQYDFAVDDFRIYRRKPEELRRGSR